MASETGAEAFIRQQQAIISRPDSRPDLACIDCPTLVLVGDTDQLTHPSGRSRSPTASRGPGLVVVAGSSHLTPLD
jgi:pimeloyl-ACP methyl ester carboxylesterase